MDIVLTGSLGTIGKPLAQNLVHNGHPVTVSSQAERQIDIEALGAQVAISLFQDEAFLLPLSAAFRGADIVYLMEDRESIGSSLIVSFLKQNC